MSEYIRFLAAGGTDVGKVRKTNQDSFGAKIMHTKCGDAAAAIMCDGMGGYQNGEVASATVVDAFQKWLLRRLPEFAAQTDLEKPLDVDVVFKEWTEIVDVCNRRILRYGQKRGITLGTTAAMFLALRGEFLILNVGDCRVYQISDEIKQITVDQTVTQAALDSGEITAEQAATDSRSHILTECIGIAKEVRPNYYRGKLLPEAVYMLCCDGFRHKVEEKEFFEAFDPRLMTDSLQMQQQIYDLIELNMERGETDNISSVAIRCITAEGSSEGQEFAVQDEFCFTSSTELAK